MYYTTILPRVLVVRSCRIYVISSVIWGVSIGAPDFRKLPGDGGLTTPFLLLHAALGRQHHGRRLTRSGLDTGLSVN